MLDWSRIDNQNTFQNLVNHLFFLECPSTLGFIPFSPYIGKDGGWDGRYQGRYPSENLEGSFCIQAKYTKHNLKQAMPSLRNWAKEELDKAASNKVEHLRLATCANLRNELIAELERLNGGRVETFKVWHGHDLLMRIERQPFLRSYYFGSPAIPLFVPPSVYFKEVEKGLSDIDGNILNQINAIKDRLDEIISFLKDEMKRVFVIHAPGGYGKSHLLREFPIQSSNAGINREVWFIRDGIRDVRDAFNDEIGVRENPRENHKYIFVVDDADRADDIKDILNCILKSGIDAKVLISLRTAGMRAMKETLISARCSDLATETCIPDWSNDELKALLRAVVQKDNVNDEDEIVRRFPNPFFIVRIGSNIRGKNNYDFQSTERAILQSLRSDSRQALSSEQIDIKTLLLNLTLITPINTTDPQTIIKLAQRLNVREKKISSILNKLVEGSVLRRIGNNLRFVPDMIGDVFLLKEMKSLPEEDRKQVFLYWFNTHSKNIFCNLGATLRYGDKDFLVPIVSNVISGWIANADKYDSYEKRQILENLEDICNVAPDKTINLLWTFLNDPGLNTDAYGPIIARLFYSDLDRKELVKIVEELRAKVKPGTYSNYKPDTLVKEAVNPLPPNSIEKQIMPLLAIIEESLGGTDPLIEFAKNALQEVLASSHEWTRSTYSSMQFGSSALKATDSVLTMRKKAIEIVKTMLIDGRPAVRSAAIEIAENIGRDSGPGVPNIPLKDKIIEERREILEVINSNDLVSKETEQKILSSYEDLLFGWWAHQDVPDEVVLPLLDKFKYGSEYRILRYYTSRWDICDDIRDTLKSAPSKDRWAWVVGNIMQRKWHLRVDDFQKDAVSLNGRYSTPELVADFLHNLGDTITISFPNALFLRAWVKENPETFKKIRLQKNLWERIPLPFKYTITYDLVQHYTEMAQVIFDEVLSAPEAPINETKIAIDILANDLPSVDRRGIIKSIAEKDIDDLNLAIIEKLPFIREKIPAKEMAEIVLMVLSHLSPQARAKSIDQIGFILYEKDKGYIDDFFSVTRQIIYSTLVGNGDLDYHDFRVMALLFVNVEELLTFMERRLEREKETRKYSEYKAVPYRGIDFIDRVIKNPEDYLYAINKALEWDEKYEGTASYSVSKIFEQIVSLKDSSGRLYLDTVKSKFYDRKAFSKFLDCLSQLPLHSANTDIFSEAIQKSKELNHENKIIKLLKSKIYPEGGWESSVGQVPPAFLEKKAVFENLRSNAPEGPLRNALDECLMAVDNMIENHQKEEEDRFHSR